MDLDRDFLSEHNVITAGELSQVVLDMTYGKKCDIFVCEGLPVLNWQSMVSVLDEEVHLFYGSLACKQVPFLVRIA